MRKFAAKAICLFFIFFGFTPIAFGAEGDRPIVVNGDQVEYMQAERRVVGSGNISIEYEDLVLTCDSIKVELDSHEALAEGDVKLVQGGNELSGPKVRYNFDTQQGIIEDGEARYPPFYGKAEMIDKSSETEMVLKKGYITTCSHENPHYKISSKKIEIYLDKKVVAKNVIVYIADIPILYLPIYVQPLIGARMNVSLVPGHNKDWGTYLLSAWRYHITDQAKGYLHLDWREDKGFAEGLDYKYDTAKFGSGLFRGYYMQERDRSAQEGTKGEDERWRVKYRHKWQINEEISAIGEYNELSDTEFLKDYYYREEFEQEGQPTSFISLLMQEPSYTLSLYTRKRANRFLDVVERVPEIELDMRPQRVGGEKLYYNSNTSAANLAKKYSDTSLGDKNAMRVDRRDEFSYKIDLADSIHLLPKAALRQTYYSRDNEGPKERFRAAFSTGADISTRIHKTFDYNKKFLSYDVEKLRHVITPTLSYNYTHSPTVSRYLLEEFDSIDRLSKDNRVTLDITNKLQVKYRDKGTLRSVDLARLVVSTDYLFKMEDGEKFSDINFDLEMRPADNFYLEAEADFSPETDNFETINFDMVAHEGDKWRIGIGHRYEKSSASQLTVGLSSQIGKDWRLRIYERYDFEGNELEEQEYGITRDLHCWLVDFVYNVRDAQTFWLVFRLKAFPDLPLKLSTTFKEPKRSQPGYVE
ncbi:MAG: LPS-assembly protein LptD [Candidatus Omnitrophica bacterium]|nr:LPS-assembly protein LptD [Candidatus Omnitrophota bacterium]